ncbi:TonB-dependent receptor [Rhodanobacter thiooxydans]|uniref:TonB-dependent receptor n=1 Tax=Rhodanobacter thiooxydans TaxID=416169 RepID=A0A154QI87_9GAMM|nr:TonB-dependent receptor [Rhodanobacter thiooxydans]EIL98360.1 TonB-dependent receptor-like protein [Rhodanobacter thiooxydans LCS2]KZC23839.1 TonB-dependent receptor [Rhodanobacter thiooxydans]
MRMRVLTMCCLASLLGAGLAGPATAAPFQQSVSESAITAMPLNKALDTFAQREHLQLVYVSTIADGLRTQGAPAGLSPEKTLQKLLEGTGLGYRFLNAKTVTIYVSAEPPASRSKSAKKPVDSTKGAKTETTNLDTVTVTGTRIRGGTTPSPVITIGSEQIQQEGFSDLGEVIRSIPQNFNGGQNPGIVGGAESGGIANQNISGGSSLNLRGLGPDATLTLLNGRRLAYSGFVQAVEIDAIPVDAVDRLEIIPDGASAIYGSDAVGGVGNVILKRDYDGVTLGTSYGAATDGGLTTRDYTATAGTYWRTGGFITTWKKSTGQPIYSDQRDYTHGLPTPTTLYPQNDLHSGLLSIHQSVGSRLELQLDAFRTRREQLRYYTAIPTRFYPATSKTTTTFVAPSAEIALPNDWTLSLAGTWGKDDTLSGLSIGSRATGQAMLIARSLYRNKSRSYELGAEGPLFTLPGGDARLAVGAGYRANTFRQASLISGAVSADGDDSSRFAYAELNLPLIGADQGIAGVRQLDFTAALRRENYASFGGVTTPKLGVVYGPTADLSLKASWGKSFKAPTLLQRYQSRLALLYPAAALGGTGYPRDATVLVPYGGNPDLEPERARTWSASIDFHPEAFPALEAELGWFDIDFTGRIAQPLVYQAEALRNPANAQFIDYSPTAQEQMDIIGNSTFRNYTGSPYDPAKVVAIAFNRYVNTVAQRVKGLDLSGSYRPDVAGGRLSIRGSLSWLKSSQQTTEADRRRDLAGTLFYPARINGRIGAVWSEGRVSASAFVNYVSGVTDTASGRKSGSFPTADVTLRYLTGDHADAFSGLDFALSVTNLFDRAPPLYVPVSANPPYDSTNYSPIGRFVNVSVAKHW